MAALAYGVDLPSAKRMTLGELRMLVDARNGMRAEPGDRKVRDATQADIRKLAM